MVTWLLLVMLVACGSPGDEDESTTIRITAIAPYVITSGTPYEVFVDTSNALFVQHPLFGCRRESELVEIHYAMGPDGWPASDDVVYTNINNTTGTPRAILGDLTIGSSLPATYGVHGSAWNPNGPSVVIRIPALDARVEAAIPPLETRACAGMREVPRDRLDAVGR